MSTYGIVPARGGSRGILRKNLQRVGGVPLVERTVSAALTARSLDRVLVTTDSSAIAQVARAAGADVIDRPAELGSDEASSESALLHVLEALRAAGDEDPAVIVMLQCTSPFTTAEDIDGTVTLVTSGAADCAFTAAPSHAFLWRPTNGSVEAVNHDAAVRPRRQEREPEFVETGAVYAMRTAGFLEARHRFFGRIALHPVESARAWEIDEPADLVVARAMASEMALDASALPHRIAGLALDFDGVLTDNRVVTLQDGTEGVLSDRGDGMGIEMLRAIGIPMIVLSKELNPVVEARCRKLALPVRQAVEDKVTAFTSWIAELGLDARCVLFLGNDANDVECLAAAGCGVAVADAHRSAIAAADLVLSRRGGRGAVRELADLILTRTEEA